MTAVDYRFERKTNKRRVTALGTAAALLTAGVCLAADSASVTAVRFWSLGDATRVAIEVSSEFTYKSSTLANPDRIFYDIHGATPAMVRKGIHTIAVGDGVIGQIRVAETAPDVTRVVIDLAQPGTAVASQLSNPDRLVVEVRSTEKPKSPQPPSVTGGGKLTNPRTPDAVEKSAAPAAIQSAKADSRSSEADAKKQTATQTAKDVKESASTPAKATEQPPAKAPAKEKASNRTAARAKASATETPEVAPEHAASTAAASSPSAPSVASERKAEAASTQEHAGKGSKKSRQKSAQAASETSAPKVADLQAAGSAAANDSAPSSEPSASTDPTPADLPSADLIASLPLTDRDAPADAVSAASSVRRDAVAKVTPASIEPPKEMGPAPMPAKRGGRTLTRALGLKLGRVVLDAGHGGHDVGTHGPSGYLEKDLSLDIAQRLGALIEEGLGSEVIYTRSADRYVALEDRTRIANERKADLFLSIHANSSPYRSAAGVETYVLNFSTSRSALDLAARENASSTSSISDLQELLNKIALKDKIDESTEFATRLQSALSTLSSKSNESAKNRGVKRAPFVVLIGANMPSVLAEIGFLSNSNDEALLMKPEHRQKIAEALYKGIASYASTLSRFRVAKN